MKPVNKGADEGEFNPYGKAKPKLIGRIGAQCSYCERSKDPQDLHIEHIYPKDPHPELRYTWKNFLLACNSCNTYKHHYQGSNRLTNIENTFVWPHIDNTFLAFNYHSDGLVSPSTVIPHPQRNLAEATLNMVGFLKSPAVTASYNELKIAYDGVRKRSTAWEKAESIYDLYVNHPKKLQITNTLALQAVDTGHFSIWMKVFENELEFKKALIHTFKADPTCFDNDGNPQRKGKI